MSLTTILNRIDVVTAEGVRVIPTTFQVQRAEDLSVYLTPDGGVETLLTYGTHYSISGLMTNAVSITLVTAASANDRYTLIRAVQMLQDVSLRTQGSYNPETTEFLLDRIVMMIQQLNDLANTANPGLSRALLLGVTDVLGEGAYDALSNRIENLEDPDANQDAATKVYVDTAVAGVVSNGTSFIAATTTLAARPTAGVAYDGLVYRIRDAGLPDVLYVCLRQSSGSTYEWVAFANATA